MRKTLHTAILILTVCLVQFFTVATLKVLNAGAPGGQAPASGGLDCVSGDVNSDDALNIADAIYVLTYLFNGGPEPVACAGNPTEVVVTGIADVNVVNTAAVEVTNTPDVNVANIPSVTVTNIPEVIVTNTADINVVSMPLVSEDFVRALGQYFPKAGSMFQSSLVLSSGPPVEFTVLTVPDNQVFRITRIGYRGTLPGTGQSQPEIRIFIDSEEVTGQFSKVIRFSNNSTYQRVEGLVSNGVEALPGQTISVIKTDYSNGLSTSFQGYFLDYTP